MGLAYLATYIAHKIGFTDMVIVDGNIENVHKRLQFLRPDLIGISAMSLRYCVFCSTSVFWDKYRYHSIPYVVDNIRYLVEKIGVRGINILDDLFIVNKKRLVDLTVQLRDQNLLGKVIFACTARSNHIDEEMCEILKNLNVRLLNFGFESGSEECDIGLL